MTRFVYLFVTLLLPLIWSWSGNDPRMMKHSRSGEMWCPA